MLRKKLADAAVGCWQVRLAAKPIGLNIIQAYAPTRDHSDDEVDLFYQQLYSVRSQCRTEVTIVMGDLNAKVGECCSGNMVGSFGLGNRNTK